MSRAAFVKLKLFRHQVHLLWDERIVRERAGARKSFFAQFHFFILLVAKRFTENRGFLRASSLAYTTLLALVPLLAVALMVATSMLRNEGGADRIEELLQRGIEKVAPSLNLVPAKTIEELDGKPEAAPDNGSASTEANSQPPSKTEGTRVVAQKIYNYIKRANSGTLGATSVIALVLVAITLLSTIENTFNDIWGVARGRGWFARLVYYWATISLGPVLFLFVKGIGVISIIRRFFSHTPVGVLESTPLSKLAFDVFSSLVLCLGFGAFYFLMPNTRVNYRSAIIGGLIGGALWQLNSVFSSLYVSRVFTYTQIYGPLGLLPIFLVSIYFSWIFVLLGAQVAYIHQNFSTYLQEAEADKINQHGREFIGLRIMTLLGDRFVRGEGPLSALDISERLSVSSRLISQILGALLQGGLVVEAGGQLNYMVARPLDQVTAYDVLESLRMVRGHAPSIGEERGAEWIRSVFDRILEAERSQARSVTLAQLVEQTTQSKGTE